MNKDLCYTLKNQIDKLAEAFMQKYFSGDPELKITCYRVEDQADTLSYNLYINEYFFCLDDIYTAIWYDIPFEVLTDWYDHRVEYSLAKNGIGKKKKLKPVANLKNY